MSSLHAIKVETFSADVEQHGSAFLVSMKGNADMAVHELLKTFLDRVHFAVRRGKADQAVFEFSELYFMNSSCLSLLLRFLNGIVELPEKERYRVVLRSNGNLRWQTKSLAALKSYAPDIVVIE